MNKDLENIYGSEADGLTTQFRGMYIHYTVKMEMYLDLIVSGYFCDNEDKKNEMIYVLMISKKMDLSHKRNHTKYIMENHFANYLSKYPTLFKDIEDIIGLRNMFSHSKNLELKEEDDFVTFINLTTDKSRIKVEEIKITFEKYNEYASKQMQTIKILKDFYDNYIKKKF